MRERERVGVTKNKEQRKGSRDNTSPGRKATAGKNDTNGKHQEMPIRRQEVCQGKVKTSPANERQHKKQTRKNKERTVRNIEEADK